MVKDRAPLSSTALVLVPDMNCTEALFRRQSEALSGRVAITVADTGSDDTMTAMAKRLLAAAPRRFALAGHGMGAFVALEVMREAPQRVERLALLNGRASLDMPEDAELRLASLKLTETGRFDDVHAARWSRLVHIRRLHDTELEAEAKAMAERTGPARSLRQLKAVLSRPDFEPGLKAIRCPTLVLAGADDAVSPPFMSEDIAEAIKGADLVVVPDCGHLSPLERPEAVTAALEGWLGV